MLKGAPPATSPVDQFDEAAVQKEDGKTDLNDPEDSCHARFAPQHRAVSAALCGWLNLWFMFLLLFLRNQISLVCV